MESFGERLRRLRRAHRLTQQQLGEALGVTGAAVSAYELQKNQPDFAMLQKLADHFAVTIDYLVGHTDDPQGAGSPVEPTGQALDPTRELLDFLRGTELTPEDVQAIKSYLAVRQAARKVAKDSP